MRYRHGVIGLVLLLGGTAGSLAGLEWVRTWYYQFAWWGYILIVDAVIQWRSGDSLIVNRRSTFWVLCFVSAAFWFGWELVNLRLHNWHYIGVPRQAWQRWPGAFIAYATVLPGIFSTYELLQVLGVNPWSRIRPLRRPEKLYPYFLAIGTISFVLPLVWPRLFFPLVWVALVFLLEPLNHRAGVKSLLGYWQKGDLSPLARLLLAGLVCGLLWEGWNFLSGARWAYTIPYLAHPKLFAMPLAGFGGFPPFAVECYVFFATVSILRGGRGWERDDHDRMTRQPAPRWVIWLLGLAALGFDVLMLRLIDLYLIKGWI